MTRHRGRCATCRNVHEWDPGLWVPICCGTTVKASSTITMQSTADDGPYDVSFDSKPTLGSSNWVDPADPRPTDPDAIWREYKRRPDPPDTPRVQGEVIGFRSWAIDEDLRLTGVTYDTTWDVGWNQATCGKGHDHAVPHHGCDCGWYAYHDTTHRWSSIRLDPMIQGAVVAAGRLEVHGNGFRAERARVVAIGRPADRPRDAVLADAVAKVYGVPCVDEDDLERVAMEYGQPVPVDLRPPQTLRYIGFAGGYVRGLFQTSAHGRIGAPSSNHVHIGARAVDFSLPTADTQTNLRAAIHYMRQKYSIGRVADAVLAADSFKAAGMAAMARGRVMAPQPPAPTDPVAKARARRPRYDPRAFQPKRKGGHR